MTVPPFHWWRTVFWLIPTITVYTVVLGFVSLLSMFLDRQGNFAHKCARGWSWLILATTGVRVRVKGLDQLDPKKSYVFVSNHQSIYDFPVLITSIPFQLRILAKASLGAFPVLGWHLRYTGHLLIDRARVGRSTLASVASLMKRGHSLILFPEGTRSIDGEVLRFKPGIFSLAIDAKLPIVPIAVIGSRRVMQKGRLMTCPGSVELVVHQPLQTIGLDRRDARNVSVLVHETIKDTVCSYDPVTSRTSDSVVKVPG